MTLSKLTNNKVDIPSVTFWLLDGNLVHENDIGFFEQQLGAGEGLRYTGFKRRERKRQFLLGRMLLRFAVSNLLSIPPDSLGVVERTCNVPQLVFPDSQRRQPRFSLSHSREWVACVVSFSIHLGVDIEVNDPTRNVLGISEFAFHPNEHRWLLPQVGAARLSAFYQLWCAREALYKLMSNLGHETVLLPLVDVNGVFASRGPGWHCYTLPHSLLMVTVCSDRPLSALYRVELPRLTPADWLAAERVSINSRNIGRLPIYCLSF